jgi:hypothetical protein
MTRYEGARFSDGSVAIRRIDEDPCERHTLTFETVRECNEELGREDLISWVADEVPQPAPRVVGRGVDALFGDLPAGCVPIVGEASLIGFTRGGEAVHGMRTLRTWEPQGDQSPAHAGSAQRPTLVRNESQLRQEYEASPCSCCGKPSNPERTSMPRCDWCMSRCRIATGRHTTYEPTEETEEQ